MEQMSLRGIEFHTSESPQAILKSADGSLSLKTNKGMIDGFSHIMFATGRMPNTKVWPFTFVVFYVVHSHLKLALFHVLLYVVFWNLSFCLERVYLFVREEVSVGLIVQGGGYVSFTY